ncbi:MAG TPA: response regulator [Jatrophihabitans sp.]|jgi:DNA-binding response OmpR family regulator
MAVPVSRAALVVDDEDDVRFLITVVLSDGYHVCEAADATAALAAARTQRFDIYVIDIRLPDMNGRDLCRRLKDDRATAAPVMLISAESSPDEIAAAYAAGCDDFLGKPFSPRQLAARVDALLDDSRAYRRPEPT